MCCCSPSSMYHLHADDNLSKESDLDGIGQGMAQMQGAGHIGRRDDDDKWRLSIVLLAGFEVSLLLPPVIPVLQISCSSMQMLKNALNPFASNVAGSSSGHKHFCGQWCVSGLPWTELWCNWLLPAHCRVGIAPTKPADGQQQLRWS